MYPTKVPRMIHWLFPRYLWRVSGAKKQIFLTFDDGPTPGITPWVLGQLAAYDAKATFFLIGGKVEHYADIGRQIVAAGHRIGNHSHTHLNGWRTSSESYLADVQQAQTSIKQKIGVSPTLFRPPYAHIRGKQARALLPQYRIVMLDVFSGDFDMNLSGEECVQNVIRQAKAGSIVVLHDSEKAAPRLKASLPQILQYFHEKGFEFCSLPDDFN